MNVDEILESLSPRSRDKYILANLKQLTAKCNDFDSDSESSVDLTFDASTDEMIDMGVMNTACCANPCFVIDENCHDQICTNCGDANHCATLTVGTRCIHFETAVYGTVSSKAVYKRVTHFKRYLRDLQGGVVNVPEKLLEDVRAHVPCNPTAAAVLQFLRHRRYMRYYNQSRFIAQKLGSTQNCPMLSSSQTMQLTRLFLKYSSAFDRFKQKEMPARKNFLSYSFILRKLLKELQYHDVLPYVKKLKCTKTRLEQEAIWAKLPQYF